MPNRLKTLGQQKAIFAEARKRGIDIDELRDIAGGSIRALTHTQAEQLIQRLKGSSFVPRRTLQYRRQKQHVDQLVTKEQLTLIAELASQRPGWTAESMVKFCHRVIKKDRPRTTADANKVIEALKAMNRREGLWAA